MIYNWKILLMRANHTMNNNNCKNNNYCSFRLMKLIFIKIIIISEINQLAIIEIKINLIKDE